ncbi:SusD/RagB family nutrient-binding outer membrane lipoprotein [Flavobacterium sp.]|uniref:SusD/RagB family nutrient-binding outer membrane lipoprotein n=1 Tax=Flavobacterium sp. TaxID=239 RepID=UPI0022C536F1|nr:SusD/RagB family nutrient-binding outer membrane lipoprotein [Flavobacterium sp.]MCZ8227973.1 SusD/RagB family nutrient-binding outer membrane lipoprotein [Flavobacterium sp.]
MKNIFIKSISLCFIGATLFSCTDYVSDYNVDPDSITDSDAKNLFQGILLADQFFQTSSNTRDVMIWLNQANGENRQYVALNDWNLSTASAFDDSWNNAYVNCITNAKITSLKAEKELNPRLAGAAQVIEAHAMGAVTALWGDAPYSELDITGNNLTPKYDSQIAIYSSLQSLLDKAITNLKATTGKGIPSDKDLYYAGSAAKWIKLAYSLKARYYLHVKDYTKAKTNALLGMSSASDDLIAKFGNSSGQNFNPFYDFLVYQRDDYMSGDSYGARLLDPSTTLYRGNSKTDEHARFAFCYNQEYFSPYSLNIYGGDYGGTNGKFGSDSGLPMVTYGEMLLIIAEVDARSSFATGLSSYNTYRALLNTGYSIGISNSGYESETFKYAPYDAADFAAGGIENNTGAALSDQNALLREIFQERYIYFMGSFESYNDFGRSNNTAQIQLKAGKAGTPQRFLYPQVEINANPNTPSPIPSIVTKTPVHQ